MQVLLSQDFLNTFGSYSAAFVVARDISVTPADASSALLLGRIEESVRQRFHSPEDIAAHPHSLAYRDFAKAMGLKPKELALPERQIRRALVTGGLRSINNVVDLYFEFELLYNLSIGAHDLNCIQGDLVFDIAGKPEEYVPIGGTPSRVRPGELLLRDLSGILYAFSKGDADRAKVTSRTKNVLIRIDGAPGIPSISVEKVAREIAGRLSTKMVYTVSDTSPAVQIG